MRKPPTPEQKAAAAEKRAALIARSRPLQAARKAGLLPWAMLPTVNACLELIYQSEVGQNEWHTFPGWKELGFFPEKGSKGFAIWGTPKRGGVKEHEAKIAAAGVDPASVSEEGKGYEFFPVSYLFHAGQVVNAEGARPPSYVPANPLLAAVKAMPLALPAPAEVAA